MPNPLSTYTLTRRPLRGDTVGGGASFLLALGRLAGVGRFEPHNGLIASGDYEQAITAGRCAEVADLDHTPVPGVAHAFQQGHKPPSSSGAAVRVRYQELLVHRHCLAWRRDDVLDSLLARRVRHSDQLYDAAGVVVTLGDHWPHRRICFTFSRLITRGGFLPAHFRPIHDRLRITRWRGCSLAAWRW